mmetsp:Transcript_7437/g.18116  ORF Transcript_7437/g.18116 Transcript_7437/m.18116 type:complete len:217 (+) Transcript_7437:303-953(+)
MRSASPSSGPGFRFAEGLGTFAGGAGTRISGATTSMFGSSQSSPSSVSPSSSTALAPNLGDTGWRPCFSSWGRGIISMPNSWSPSSPKRSTSFSDSPSRPRWIREREGLPPSMRMTLSESPPASCAMPRPRLDRLFRMHRYAQSEPARTATDTATETPIAAPVALEPLPPSPPPFPSASVPSGLEPGGPEDASSPRISSHIPHARVRNPARSSEVS